MSSYSRLIRIGLLALISGIGGHSALGKSDNIVRENLNFVRDSLELNLEGPNYYNFPRFEDARHVARIPLYNMVKDYYDTNDDGFSDFYTISNMKFGSSSLMMVVNPPAWYVYDRDGDGMIKCGEVLYDPAEDLINGNEYPLSCRIV